MIDIINSTYGFSKVPFANNIDCDSLYLSNDLQVALATLEYIALNSQMAVFTGDVGVGKSTALRLFAHSLNKTEYQIFYVSDSQLTPRWLYSTLLKQVGIDGKLFRGDSKRLFQTELYKIKETLKKKVIVIIDETHLLPVDSLQEIRFLLNTEMDSCSPLALILTGQDELWTKLHSDSCRAIRQRVDMSIRLTPLTEQEIYPYIQSHLRFAGCDKELFNAGAISAIYSHSSGIMRIVNKLCVHSLFQAISDGTTSLITEQTIEKVVKNPLNQNLAFC